MKIVILTSFRAFILVLSIIGSLLIANPAASNVGQSFTVAQWVCDSVFFMATLYQENRLDYEHAHWIIYKIISTFLSLISAVTSILNLNPWLGFLSDFVSIACQFRLCLYQKKTWQGFIVDSASLSLNLAASAVAINNGQVYLYIMAGLEVLSAWIDYTKWFIEMIEGK